MNAQAIPVLIAFLAIACVAAFLLRRAFTALNRQQIKPGAERIQTPHTRGGRQDNLMDSRSAP
ncbi:hypothetical protein UF78_02655 [Stutzerimonas stutzeri]|uniref:Uncharacterized protein n=1 Tax=Stutzerimonas stutzeri TaxID=316 RepID=A0A0D9AY11_STUST|nr:hypothetical protein UF78_02655 [Stutzerimonas stutzeri]